MDYQHDFHAWLGEQAALLRAGHLDALDALNLAEEIESPSRGESIGRSERHQLENRLAVLLAHLLQWQFQPALRSRSWELTLKEQRRSVERRLRLSPSLQATLEASLQEAYQDARLLAERETGLGEDCFPPACPFSLAQTLDPAFLPG